MPGKKGMDEGSEEEHHYGMHGGWGKHKHEMPDPRKVKEILAVVREEIPGMLRDIVDVLYNEKSAQNMGRAVGTYYKTLKESGIPQDIALEMTKGYVINIGKMFDRMRKGEGFQP